MKRFIVSLLILVSVAISVWLAGSLKFSLFTSTGWLVFFAPALGIFLGTTAGLQSRRSTSKDRHTVFAFLEHWGTASGIFLMIYSGFQIYHGTFTLFQVNLHFTGLVLALIFGVQFVTDFVISKKYHELLPDGNDILKGTLGKYILRTKWQDTGKYLASQKAAFLAFVVLGSEIVITGFIKMAVFYTPIPVDVIKMATQIHDVAGVLFVLMLLVHVLSVIAVKSHRKLLRSWFGGGVVVKIPEPEELEKPGSNTIKVSESPNTTEFL